MPQRLKPTLLRAACSVALAAWLSTAVDATTLAIIRTGDEIIIAADSLMTLYGRRPQLTCKIRRFGEAVFATAGLVSTEDGVPEFHTVITNILRRRLPWPQQARQVEEWLRQPLLRTLRRLEREFPDEFQAHLRQRFALHVSLAGIHDGRPALEIREYFVERGDDRTLQLEVGRISCPAKCPDQTQVFGVGETDEMMRRVGALERLPPDLGRLASDLVKAEIRHHPGHVGPPVDVVRVRPTGIGWLHRKAACPV